MTNVGRSFFFLAIAAPLLCLACVTFAEDGLPGGYPSYTQIKPTPPDLQRTYPALPPNRDQTLLSELPIERIGPMSAYWIGVQCAEVMPALSSHLNLAEHEGVLVEGVVPESPAAKAGVEQYDVILSVNGKPVAKIEDIISTVNEVKDAEMTISAIRKGQPVELKVTPEKRPDSAKLPVRPPRQGFFRSFGPGAMMEEWNPDSPDGAIPEDIRRMFEQLHKQMEDQMKNLPESGRFGMESLPDAFRDGMQVFGGTGAGTNTMQITIDPARDDGEATLTVRKNGQTWSVSQFSDLPEAVQKEMANVLAKTVDGKDVDQWVDEQMKSNRRLTFSVTVAGNPAE